MQQQKIKKNTHTHGLMSNQEWLLKEQIITPLRPENVRFHPIEPRKKENTPTFSFERVLTLLVIAVLSMAVFILSYDSSLQFENIQNKKSEILLRDAASEHLQSSIQILRKNGSDQKRMIAGLQEKETSLIQELEYLREEVYGYQQHEAIYEDLMLNYEKQIDTYEREMTYLVMGLMERVEKIENSNASEENIVFTDASRDLEVSDQSFDISEGQDVEWGSF